MTYSTGSKRPAYSHHWIFGQGINKSQIADDNLQKTAFRVHEGLCRGYLSSAVMRLNALDDQTHQEIAAFFEMIE